jgi:hypothetical protein
MVSESKILKKPWRLSSVRSLQTYSNRPKWNKLKPPGCRMIIGRSFHAAVIANRFRTVPCSERELDLACFGHACLGIHEALLLFYAIEDSLSLHLEAWLV